MTGRHALESLRKGAVVLALTLGITSAALEAGERSGLPACPPTPNCVSSGSRVDSHYIRPLAFEGSADAAWQRLKSALALESGLAVVTESPADWVLRAQATSRVFRFVDDVELRLLPEAKIIEMRSASRVGYWDLGVNRRRLERLRERFDGLGAQR